MSTMNENPFLESTPVQQSYTIARGINGILWIWEKIEDNLWKVYAYEAPQAFHFEDDLGNWVTK
jgi:hypothetical protein